MTPKRWLALVRDIASGTVWDRIFAGTDLMERLDIPETPTSETPAMDKTWHSVYCDGELLANPTEYHIAKSIYDNATGVHKELYRHERDKVALILHKESYGVPIK